MESYTVKNLSFTYPAQTRKALDDLSFSVRQGEFVALCGPSGCGKSTLLRQLKSSLSPHGELEGEILFEGADLSRVGPREQSAKIGFVMQNPDNQIVTDKVWHELAFGLESLGTDTRTIRARVAEMSSFFGIQAWFYKNVTELSGGQKQLLNLASIMVMQPSVLILDEPTSQLDPIAASDFLATVGRINRELGTTVIMTEHRLEDVFPMSSRVLVLDGGRLICDGTPREVGERLRGTGHGMFFAMPTPMRVFAAVPNTQECPITVRDGRMWLDGFAAEHELRKLPPEPDFGTAENGAVITLSDVHFKYEKDAPDVVRGLSFEVRRGELLAIVGGNGAGKTTTLSIISGINRPYRGRVCVMGTDISKRSGLFDGLLGVLPQNPQALFVKKTVREDLGEILKSRKLDKSGRERKILSVARFCRLDDLLDRHPYDLSGGEQQRAALAKVLLLEPRILLLDEPTKGFDAEFKLIFAEILQGLLSVGVTIVMVSHDIEFCAKYAHRCAMFFDGGIVSHDTPRAFFGGNSFYTTSANRMARHLLPQAVTAEDVITACGGELPPAPKIPDLDELEFLQKREETEQARKKEALPFRRRLLAGISGAVIVLLAVIALREPDIPWLFGGGNPSVRLYALLITAMLVFAASVSRREGGRIKNDQIALGERKLPRRTAAAMVMILLLIPLTIYFGIFYLGDRKYYFISLLIVLETTIPFFLAFEGRKPRARELVVISVLCAIGVAGRSAFFMLPQFKPVTAVSIISGVAFGGEAGFLVGAVTMLASNVMFGQGPLTPWQMFAMGIIGFLAGVLFRKGLLRRSRLPLCIFGGLAAIIVYGGIMNPAFVLSRSSELKLSAVLLSYAVGFPMDLVHAAATVFFLWFASKPMLEKLDRIKVKYGLVE